MHVVPLQALNEWLLKLSITRRCPVEFFSSFDSVEKSQNVNHRTTRLSTKAKVSPFDTPSVDPTKLVTVEDFAIAEPILRVE